jgi:hypothetical protein
MVAFGTAALMIATLVAWNLTREPRMAEVPVAPPTAPVAATPTPAVVPRPPEELAPTAVAPPATPEASPPKDTVPVSGKANAGSKTGKVRTPPAGVPVTSPPTPSAKPAGKTPRPIDRDNPFGTP